MLWTMPSSPLDLRELEGQFLDATEYEAACPSVVQWHESSRRVDTVTDITLKLKLAWRQE